MSNKVPIYIIRDIVYLHKKDLTQTIQLTQYEVDGGFMFYTIYGGNNKIFDFFNITTDRLHTFLPIEAMRELYRDEKNSGYYEIHAEYDDKYILSTSFENFLSAYYKGSNMKDIVESWNSWNVYDYPA